MKILSIGKNSTYSQNSRNSKKAGVSFQGAITTELITKAYKMKDGKYISNQDFELLVQRAHKHVKEFLETARKKINPSSKQTGQIEEIDIPGHYSAKIDNKNGLFNLTNFDEGDRLYFEAGDKISKLRVYDAGKNYGFVINKNLKSCECRFIELSNNT